MWLPLLPVRSLLKISFGKFILSKATLILPFLFASLWYMSIYGVSNFGVLFAITLGQILYFGAVHWTFHFRIPMYFHQFKRIRIIAVQLMKVLRLALLIFHLESCLMEKMRKVRLWFLVIFLLTHLSQFFIGLSSNRMWDTWG